MSRNTKTPSPLPLPSDAAEEAPSECELGRPPSSSDAEPVPCAGRINGAEAADLVRAYHPLIAAWATETVERRVRGLLRTRALAEIVPAVPGDVSVRFIVAARRGMVRVGNIRGMLFRITERAAMNAVKARWRLDRRERPALLATGSAGAEPIDDTPDAETSLVARETTKAGAQEQLRLLTLVRLLPDRDRGLLSARFSDEPVPFRDLGARFGISEEAARTATFRAVRKLRASIGNRRAA